MKCYDGTKVNRPFHTLIHISEWAVFNVPLNDHFGDKSFQAIDCTGTDNQKQGNKTLHTPETQKRNRKKLPWLTKQTSSWFGMPFMTSSHEMEQAVFLQPQKPQGAVIHIRNIIHTLCLKKPHWCSTLWLLMQINQFLLFWQVLLRECAIKRWFVLTNVSALHGEKWAPKIVSFQSCCIQYPEDEMVRREIIFAHCT